MRIRTWYNLTQDKYKTDYSQGVLDLKEGYINKQGHLLIGNMYFYDKKVFYNGEARDKYFYKKIHSAKKRFKKKLIKLIQKI